VPYMPDGRSRLSTNAVNPHFASKDCAMTPPNGIEPIVTISHDTHREIKSHTAVSGGIVIPFSRVDVKRLCRGRNVVSHTTRKFAVCRRIDFQYSECISLNLSFYPIVVTSDTFCKISGFGECRV